MIDENKIAMLLKVLREPAKRQQMVSAFESGADEHIRQLKVAVAGGDREAFFKRAHSLKGSAGTMGLTALASLCSDIEARETAVSEAEMRAFAESVTHLYEQGCMVLHEVMQLEEA